MKFKITTDYAIRIIGYLAQHNDQLLNSNTIAEQLGITNQYFLKVAISLKEFGFIETEQGRYGGYRLAKDANDITLYDIIETMEGAICINRCLVSDGYCSIHATQTCSVHKIMATIQSDIINIMKDVKMSNL